MLISMNHNCSSETSGIFYSNLPTAKSAGCPWQSHFQKVSLICYLYLQNITYAFELSAVQENPVLHTEQCHGIQQRVVLENKSHSKPAHHWLKKKDKKSDYHKSDYESLVPYIPFWKVLWRNTWTSKYLHISSSSSPLFTNDFKYCMELFVCTMSVSYHCTELHREGQNEIVYIALVGFS